MYQAPRRPALRQARPAIKPKTKVRKILVLGIFAVLIACALVAIVVFFRKSEGSPTSSNTKGQSSNVQTPAGFNKQQYSLDDPSSLWIVVNKKRQLNPKDFTPKDLVVPNIPLRSNITSTEKLIRKDTATALEAMVKAAADRGVHLNLQSGYRSYSFQISLYNGYVKQLGQTTADKQSARAGYSEHQTGLAADLGGTSQPGCNVAQCFGDTTEGKWLAANAYQYGFIIRYTAEKESVAGYEYEPWHVRYVGTELSTEMHKQGIETLEEFFGLGAAPTY